MIRPTYKEGLPDYLCMQVITNEEAERRGRVYDANGRTYLFDLDYNDGDCPFTVDAGRYGNVSHFVNHSVSVLLAQGRIILKNVIYSAIFT